MGIYNIFELNVAILCNDDYANFAYNLEQSLLSIGISCKGYKNVPHVFNYPNQLEINRTPDLTPFDIIIQVHGDTRLIENKINIPYYTGTAYRQSPEYYNELFKDSPFSLIALPEFQQTARNYKYLVGAINLQPSLTYGSIFGHYPSNKDVKGSYDIINIMQSLPVQFDFDLNRVDYDKHIERLKGIDIYIEMMASTQGGKPYGSFGITALESAALGKQVITQSVNDCNLYLSTYGITPALHFINNREQLIQKVLNFKELDTLRWVNTYHSYEATGNMLKDILNGL